MDCNTNGQTTAAPPPTAKPDIAQAERALRLLFDEGQVVELRAIGKNNSGYPETFSGYFDDYKKLAAAAITANKNGNVYFTLNPVKPDLLARRCNRSVSIRGRDPSTADDNILRRQWLPIDLDAQRASGISASDLEHNLALEHAEEIRRHLVQNLGWAEPIYADSGNGAHLLFRIDLPADDDGLVKRVLAKLAERFDNDDVHVDTGVFNPARIWKLYGTVARKGDSTPDRPHRLSQLLYVPDEIERVSLEQLQELAGEQEQEKQPTPKPRTNNSSTRFSVGDFLSKHSVEVTTSGPYSNSNGAKHRWKLKTCPLCGESDGSAVALEFTDGRLGYQCHHNRCVNVTWSHFREHFEPRYREAKQSSNPKRNADSFMRTDMGNAERFARKHGKNARYCHAWGKWLVWDNRRWVIDASGEVMRFAKSVARSIYAEAARPGIDAEEAQALGRWAARSEQRDRLTAMLALAESEQPIPISVDSLDREPRLFNVANGTIDLRTGKLQQHRRENYLTKLAPIEYHDDAGTEPVLFNRFLGRIFAEDAGLITFVQRLIGMALVGEVQEHVLPIFYGSGANGKSVFVETIAGVFGDDYSMKAASTLLMASGSDRHPTEVADLFGKRFVAVVETEDGKRLAESMVKEITGGDSLRARRMREDFWQFTPSHSVFMATNHRPVVRGNDHAIWRRLKLVPFQVTIPTAEQDRELTTKLRAEYSGILRWAVQGCLDWQRSGLAEPEIVRAATDGYRDSEDLIGRFLDDRCLTGASFRAKSSSLYSDYKRWAESCGEIVQTQKRFGSQMTERGFRREKQGVYWYLGITLSES